MESRATKKFNYIKKTGKKALITYITAGDPNLDTTYELVFEMEKAGVDIVELGIPYSDPLADGPVIQRASQRALKAGTKINEIFNLVERIRERSQIPIVFLVYFNSIFVYGFKKFLDRCTQKGIDGLIIPDLPLEERKELQQMMQGYAIDLIPLVALTSKDRIKAVVAEGSGFVYCISSVGVTGKRDSFKHDLSNFLDEIKKHTNLPLALGFGISTADMVNRLKDLCDGLIVGSSIVEQIEKGINDNTVVERVFDFTKELCDAKNNG